MLFFPRLQGRRRLNSIEKSHSRPKATDLFNASYRSVILRCVLYEVVNLSVFNGKSREKLRQQHEIMSDRGFCLGVVHDRDAV